MTAVNALHRGLLILRAINDGHAQLREISAATKLPKSTIARMLETLVGDGYVAQDSQKGYHVTGRVLTLSRGYNANSSCLMWPARCWKACACSRSGQVILRYLIRTPWWFSTPAAIRARCHLTARSGRACRY